MTEYFSIIPSKLRYDKKINANQKLFYAEINAFNSEIGYCILDISYFQNLFSVSKQTILRWVKILQEEGYIQLQNKMIGFTDKTIIFT